MAAPWLQNAQTTAETFLPQVWDGTLRKSPLLKMLKSKGRMRVKVPASEKEFNGRVKYKLPETRSFTGEGVLDYERTVAHKRYTLGFGGYASAVYMTEDDIAALESDTSGNSLSNRWKEMIEDCVTSVNNDMPKDLFLGTYDANKIVGIPQAVPYTTSGLVTADKIARTSGTYAGLTTALAGLESAFWSSDLASGDRPNTTLANDYPFGHGGEAYDAWSGRIVRVNANSWGTGTTGITENLPLALRQSISWHNMLCGTPIDLALLGGDWMTMFRNYWSDRIKIITEHPDGKRLGIGNTVDFEGTLLTTDWICPASSGYLLETSSMELMTFLKMLVFTYGPRFDENDLRYKFACRSRPQLNLNAKKVTRLASIAV